MKKDNSKLKYEQYVNQKINHLTILDYIYTPNHSQKHLRYQFKVRCDCGFEDVKKCNSVINNKIQTCGRSNCPFKVNSSETAIKKYRKYIGQKINSLTIIDVIYDINERPEYRYKFKCLCDCGFETELVVNSVLSNKYKSCGYLNCKYSKTSQSIEKYKNMIGTKINKLLITDLIYNESETQQYYKWQFKCKCNCGNNEYYTSIDQLLYRTPNGCNKCYTPSKIELKFSEWLDNQNIKYLKNQRIYSNHDQSTIEIDFLIDNYIGIELHGLSVHATTNQDFDSIFIGHKPKKYHLNKTLICEEYNIDLMQFWNTEFIQKPDIVKSIILNRINKSPYQEYARNCYIQEIDKKTYDQFMNNHHIQGTTIGETIRIGLFYKDNNNLVSCMSFGYSRYSNYQWELLRFANHVYSNIIGSASKLFKYFVNKYDPNSIISYANKRLFNNGKLYNILGFQFLHTSDPNYWYFKNNFSDYNHKLFHRSTFMKHKLENILPHFDPNLTEIENMENNRYLRIYDCGNNVYFWYK